MKKAIIYIYDYIGTDAASAKYIAQVVEQYEAQGVELIELHINSRGGDVFEGIAIYNYLKNKPVEVYIDGIAASIASVIAMSGKKIYMYSSSMMMVHNPWTFEMGDADYMKKVSEQLDAIRAAIINAYIERTGLKKAELESLLDQQTFMTADECKKKGFCDEVVKMKMKQKNYVAVYAMMETDTNILPQNNKRKKMNKELLALLGLDSNADDAEITAAIAGVRAKLGLGENESINDFVVNPAQPAEKQTTEGTPQADMLNNIANEFAERLIDDAIKDFKLLAVDREVWVERAKRDYKGTKDMLVTRANGYVKPPSVTLPAGASASNVSPVKAAADHLKAHGRK